MFDIDEETLKKFQAALPFWKITQKKRIDGNRPSNQSMKWQDANSAVARELGGIWSSEHQRYIIKLGERSRFEEWAKLQ